MADKNSIDLTQGPISGHILRMLGPFALAIVALLSVRIVDTIYLGRIGVDALAAMGFCLPIVFLGNSANIGLGAGTMSAVSRAIGQKDGEKAKRHAAAAILMAITVMVVLSSLLLLSMPLVLQKMGAEPHIAELARSYMLFALPGLTIVSIAMMCNNILRASGEAALPSSIMILGAVLNIIIDPFLIFGIGPFPRMEVPGAALASLIANSIAACFGLWVVLFYRKAVHFRDITLGSIGRAWRVIGRVGIPAALTNIVVPVGMVLVTSIIAYRVGTIGVATFNVVMSAEIIAVALLYALSACIGAVTGQNGGARQTDRVREAFIFCYKICVGWAIFMSIVMLAIRIPILSAFTKDQMVIEMANSYFYWVPITIMFYCFVFVTAAGFNALGRPSYGLIFTIIRSIILYVPLIGIGVYLWEMNGAFIGIAAANLFSGMIAIFWALKKAPMTARTS
ncbi:MAG: MATE family efflux transporter [Acidimicrobiales bacterium]|nr:MAG: MATE family efflux transporter [Acidimicrobiales bacterium]